MTVIALLLLHVMTVIALLFLHVMTVIEFYDFFYFL